MQQKIFRSLLLFLCIFLCIFMQGTNDNVFAQQDVAHAVLFYSPTCSHCYEVINNHLPPILDKYGDQLIIIGINTTVPEGQALYQSAVTEFNILEDRIGVPTLIIGDNVLVGQYEIPTMLPTLVDSYLEKGGIGWPSITGLSEILIKGEYPESTTQATPETSSWIDKFRNDIFGNSFSLIMLMIMTTSVVRSIIGVQKYKSKPLHQSRIPTLVVPILSIIGILVAGYLTYIETTNSIALCGPVGDCNLVQQSEYATIFGLLPVGVLGLIGYIFIISFWILYTYGPSSQAEYSFLVLWSLSAGGTIFSMYLTFLEPFIIGATCMWCLTSALIMTAIFWTTTPKAIHIIYLIKDASRTKKPTSVPPANP